MKFEDPSSSDLVVDALYKGGASGNLLMILLADYWVAVTSARVALCAL
jgi:hypothetical protein